MSIFTKSASGLTKYDTAYTLLLITPFLKEEI